MLHHALAPRRWLALILGCCLAATVALPAPEAGAQVKKKQPDKSAPKPEAKPAPRAALLNSAAWLGAPLKPTTAAEIDQLINTELESTKISPAVLTTDEQFIRRVTLDLIGKLPTPAEVNSFVANPSSQKRSQLIDQLLESEDYAKHWGRYWRDVIGARVTDRRGQLLARSFEEWTAGQIKANKSWADITRAVLQADGSARYDDPAKNTNGQAFFLLAHTGADAANDRAAETSRVFLGITIRCCQCHDHPFDQWKQVQFHEMAAYYARLRERPVRNDEKKVIGIELFSAPKGEHEMSEKNDPKKVFTVHPVFLDGKSAARDLPDKQRRQALADAVVDKNNYWFAGAYVNRMWGELIGQSFYQPVDDMGPGKEVVFAPVLVRLAAAFRATNYDMKAMFRVILNTQAYQRQIRLGASTDEHLHFAAVYPKQLPADALWASLQTALGMSGGIGGPEAKGRPMARAGLEGEFKRLFEFDPSLKADEVEGSIAQALMLMNNPAVNSRIRANGNTPLAKLLSDNPRDEDAVKALYLHTLARKPTDSELDKCKGYIKNVGNRSEAFEDLQWALVNSTEFQTKR
jgi:Protein of unknown function (DUF1549)/Protein of unknown function (DUF1553)